jgi:hypothetical protein
MPPRNTTHDRIVERIGIISVTRCKFWATPGDGTLYCVRRHMRRMYIFNRY